MFSCMFRRRTISTRRPCHPAGSPGVGSIHAVRRLEKRIYESRLVIQQPTPYFFSKCSYSCMRAFAVAYVAITTCGGYLDHFFSIAPHSGLIRYFLFGNRITFDRNKIQKRDHYYLKGN